MASRRRLYCVALFACFLQVLSHQARAFRLVPQAQSVFLRSKRANTFFVEEVLQGNLERECYEEFCSYEEAREYFENTPQTVAFWTVYYDGDQCIPNPCLNEGSCTDRVGGFLCNCTQPYYGVNCELGSVIKVETLLLKEPQVIAPDFIECPIEGPRACEQFCTVSYSTFTCSCTTGYTLDSDGQRCVPEVKHPCGRGSPSDKTHTAAPICSSGRCPWQVLLVDGNGVELCGGAVLGLRSVLTSARCLYTDGMYSSYHKNLRIRAGNSSSAVRIPIQAMYIHKLFHRERHDNDLALLQLAYPLTFGPALFQLCLPSKDFSENVLMRSGQEGLTGARQGHNGISQHRSPSYLRLDDCRRHQLNLSHPLSNKMFCMRSQNGDQGKPTVHQSRKEMQLWENDRKAQTGSQSQSELGVEGLRSGVSDRQCEFLPGTPMATEERGTAFLTGLLVSQSPSSCSEEGVMGLVFTKLSRYLTWIRVRLDLAEEASMTPQVTTYPTPPP
ncbi:protein Z, vitamin K-dependent plasma glycoprotein b [Lampris incognitus]|uniref:protein Z, vitamin K-dependent plasma glycoprotein b n=1 Tax=Lampris incognitus TaxID=2546036 RepID=UPI0024B5E792|nr:protein Z, vitamin K-dependent plasma glycoprotein b [Lampris incognitus]